MPSKLDNFQDKLSVMQNKEKLKHVKDMVTYILIMIYQKIVNSITIKENVQGDKNRGKMIRISYKLYQLQVENSTYRVKKTKEKWKDWAQNVDY